MSFLFPTDGNSVDSEEVSEHSMQRNISLKDGKVAHKLSEEELADFASMELVSKREDEPEATADQFYHHMQVGEGGFG